jgi:hypothetical protein
VHDIELLDGIGGVDVVAIEPVFVRRHDVKIPVTDSRFAQQVGQGPGGGQVVSDVVEPAQTPLRNSLIQSD